MMKIGDGLPNAAARLDLLCRYYLWMQTFLGPGQLVQKDPFSVDFTFAKRKFNVYRYLLFLSSKNNEIQQLPRICSSWSRRQLPASYRGCQSRLKMCCRITSRSFEGWINRNILLTSAVISNSRVFGFDQTGQKQVDKMRKKTVTAAESGRLMHQTVFA